MKNKVLICILLGMMMVSIVGCNKNVDEVPNDTPTNESNQGGEGTQKPNELGTDKLLYKDKNYGYSFEMPKYTIGDYYGGVYFRQKLMVYDLDGDTYTLAEKYIAVHRYLKLAHEDYIDINKIKTVYDIPNVIAEDAFQEALNSVSIIRDHLQSYDIKIADKAEKINGYDMLRYEGTLTVNSCEGCTYIEPDVYGITGYFILADGLPIVVQGVDTSSIIKKPGYDGTGQMDSVRAEVDAMVRTFSTEGWYEGVEI